MAVIMLEEDVPVTRRARFVRVGQISRVERPYGGNIALTLDVSTMRNGGAYALVSADPAGASLRPGPIPIHANDWRGVTLDSSAPSIIAGDWLWWERVETP